MFGLGCHDDPSDDPSDDPADDPSDEPSDDPADDVDIPDGLDPESDLVATLLSTERGRETLQWLADNDIEIVVDSTQTGAVWNGSEIVIGSGYDDAAVIVHEANHARYGADGRQPDATSMSREDYVRESLEEEADGTVQQILAAKEFRDAGESAPQAPGEDAYDDAYDDAIDNGASPAEAREAGAQAVLDEFTSGGFQTSNTGQSYPDYYGSYWDSVNP